MNRSLSVWASLMLTLGLSACGGGSPAPEPPTPPAPLAPPASSAPPAPAAFALTDANAVTAGTIALGALDFIKDASDLLVLAASQLDWEHAADVVFNCTEPGWAYGNLVIPQRVAVQAHHDDNDRDGSISAGDRVTAEHTACNGFARKLSIALTDYSVNAERMEGRVDFETERPAIATAAKGSYTLQLTRSRASPAALWRATDASVALTIDATTQTVTGGASSDVASNGAYRVDYTASVDSAKLQGTYGVTTTF